MHFTDITICAIQSRKSVCWHYHLCANGTFIHSILPNNSINRSIQYNFFKPVTAFQCLVLWELLITMHAMTLTFPVYRDGFTSCTSFVATIYNKWTFSENVPLNNINTIHKWMEIPFTTKWVKTVEELIWAVLHVCSDSHLTKPHISRFIPTGSHPFP
jgi:hypothetical protein